MNFFKDQKGFSLIEIMMASVLAAMLMGAFFMATRAQDAQGDMLYVKMNMEDQGMNALRKMEHELRQSSPSRIAIGSGGSSITFEVPSETSPVNTSTYAVDWTGSHTVTYAISGTQLVRTDADAVSDTTARIISNFVSGVTFAVPASGIVTVTLNLSQTLKNTRTLAKSLSANIQVRNP